MSILEKVVIIYVEDEPEVRAQIALFLRRRVKVLFEASNGEEGLKLIQEHDPDVVITDLEMPVMNGIDMIKKIREYYNGQKPIIVITGYMDDEHHTDLADAYLYKPINMHKLAEVIEELLVKYGKDNRK